MICTEWHPRQDLWSFLEHALATPTSALLVSAERSLAAEFPSHVQARSVLFVGSIKWLDRSPFDDHDLARLQHHRAALTSEPLTTVAVSRAGVACRGLGATYGPDDIVAAWRLMPQAGAGVTP